MKNYWRRHNVKNVMKHHLLQWKVKRDTRLCVEGVVGMRCMLPLCHPFTAIVSGPRGCSKTAWVLRLIDNIREMIEPVSRRIWNYYGEYQHAFTNYVSVHFEECLPQLSDEVFDGSEPSMIVVDDHMSDINLVVADIFTKISHHKPQCTASHSKSVWQTNMLGR